MIRKIADYLFKRANRKMGDENAEIMSKVKEDIEEICNIPKTTKIKMVNIIAIVDEDEKSHRIFNVLRSQENNLSDKLALMDALKRNLDKLIIGERQQDLSQSNTKHNGIH